MDIYKCWKFRKPYCFFSEYLKHYIVVFSVPEALYCCFQRTWSTILLFSEYLKHYMFFSDNLKHFIVVFRVHEAQNCCFHSTWTPILLFSEYLKHYIVVLKVPEALLLFSEYLKHYCCFQSTWSTRPVCGRRRPSTRTARMNTSSGSRLLTRWQSSQRSLRN